MGKYCVVLLLVLSCFFKATGQTKFEFGVIGGAFYGNVAIKTSGVDLEQALALIGENGNALDVLDGGGLYLGFVVDVSVVEDVSVQSELFYAGAGDESIIGLPVVVKYYFGKSFSVQGGPQLDVVLGLSDFANQFFDSFGYSGVVGFGYDFSGKIAIQTRYAFGLRNRLDDAISETLSSIKPTLRTNTLQFGLIYKF